MKLSGYIPVRNGISLDYAWREAALSLLNVCDELLLCDSDSTDGTTEALHQFAESAPRVRVINWPWENPVGDPGFFLRWLNYCRSQCSHPLQISVDADECLDSSDSCLDAIREAAASPNPRRLFHRINLWRDGNSIREIPEGHCVGRWVARMGETSAYMVSDYPECPPGCVRDGAVKDERLLIWHLGFLRRPEAFYAKARVCLTAWAGSTDSRLDKTESEGKGQWDTEISWRHLLEPVQHPYPAMVRQWLAERGHLDEPSSPTPALSPEHPTK